MTNWAADSALRQAAVIANKGVLDTNFTLSILLGVLLGGAGSSGPDHSTGLRDSLSARLLRFDLAG